MDQNRLFINSRYINGKIAGLPRYVCHRGVIKRYVASPIARKTFKPDDIYYAFDELPEEVKSLIDDMTISAEDLIDNYNAKNDKGIGVIDAEKVLIYVTPNTPLLPVVGNILPSDGTHAYTVEIEDDDLKLKPILICWGCHWSELFTGQTRYKNNVFCLASELSEELLQAYIDDIILLKDVPEYLSQLESSPNMEDEKKI